MYPKIFLSRYVLWSNTHFWNEGSIRWMHMGSEMFTRGLHQRLFQMRILLQEASQRQVGLLPIKVIGKHLALADNSH